jgi:hypothetical protein
MSYIETLPVCNYIAPPNVQKELFCCEVVIN